MNIEKRITKTKLTSENEYRKTKNEKQTNVWENEYRKTESEKQTNFFLLGKYGKSDLYADFVRRLFFSVLKSVHMETPTLKSVWSDFVTRTKVVRTKSVG